VNIRSAAEADQALLRELWEEFQAEVPEPDGVVPETWEQEWKDVLDDFATGAVFVAEDDRGPIGYARLDGPEPGGWSHIQVVYVRPRARREGVTKALLRSCSEAAREHGSTMVSLEVLIANETAHDVWKHLGFKDVWATMAQPLDALDARLAEVEGGESLATTHVQSDDGVSVERAVAHFLPRLEAPTVTSHDSWIRIADPVLDRDREAHGRFARELSERLGAVTVALALEGAVVRFRLFERGRMVDEYLSVPTYYGVLPKGDELAFAANPTLVSRLTGAERDDVRRVARTAASPTELPPAPDLYQQIARLMGLEP
jgi:GNAT superfamily N-acetyltransferase